MEPNQTAMSLIWSPATRGVLPPRPYMPSQHRDWDTGVTQTVLVGFDGKHNFKTEYLICFTVVYFNTQTSLSHCLFITLLQKCFRIVGLLKVIKRVSGLTRAHYVKQFPSSNTYVNWNSLKWDTAIWISASLIIYPSLSLQNSGMGKLIEYHSVLLLILTLRRVSFCPRSNDQTLWSMNAVPSDIIDPSWNRPS